VTAEGRGGGADKRETINTEKKRDEFEELMLWCLREGCRFKQWGVGTYSPR